MSPTPDFSLEAYRGGRTSIKWTRYPADVIPLAVAEMDYAIAPAVAETIIDRVRASDFGYLDAAGPLAPAFARFAAGRWGWAVDPETVRVTTDVSVAIVETLRYGMPLGGTVVTSPPVYDAFAELIDEASARRLEVPLRFDGESWSLDLAGLDRAFADGAGAYLLCNPQNPLGLVFDAETLGEVARLAERHDVLVISDEVHAPLTHPGVRFTPFAPIAAAAGARSVTVTSASKGWNLAGAKCALLVPASPAALAILDRFPEEVTCCTSILGLHAGVAALASVGWLDDVVARIVANDELLARLLADQLPGAVYHRPSASYLGWVDLGAYYFGSDPATALLDGARVALNAGRMYGDAYARFVRINLACDPALLVEAVRRIRGFLGEQIGVLDRRDIGTHFS